MKNTYPTPPKQPKTPVSKPAGGCKTCGKDAANMGNPFNFKLKPANCGSK